MTSRVLIGRRIQSNFLFLFWIIISVTLDWLFLDIAKAIN